MSAKCKYSYFCFYITLDMLIPLENWSYSFSVNNIKRTIEVRQHIRSRNKIGSLKVHGMVSTNPQPKRGEGNGFTQLSIKYQPLSPLTTDQFGEILNLSSIWHLSPTGLGFLINEINRIIDLYRVEASAFWWDHIGMWNFDEISIKGMKDGENEETLINTCWPKITTVGKKPL